MISTDLHVRTMRWQGTYTNQILGLLDPAQCVFYHTLVIQQWLRAVVDTVIFTFVIAMINSSLHFHGKSSEVVVGLALVHIGKFSTFTRVFVEQSAASETSMATIARLRALKQQVPVEEDKVLSPEESEQFLSNWSGVGNIVFERVSVKYKYRFFVW